MFLNKSSRKEVDFGSVFLSIGTLWVSLLPQCLHSNVLWIQGLSSVVSFTVSTGSVYNFIERSVEYWEWSVAGRKCLKDVKKICHPLPGYQIYSFY